MMYTVKRIDEDLNFDCEERPDEVPVMAIVTLVDSSGKNQCGLRGDGYAEKCTDRGR